MVPRPTTGWARRRGAPLSGADGERHPVVPKRAEGALDDFTDRPGHRPTSASVRLQATCLTLAPLNCAKSRRRQVCGARSPASAVAFVDGPNTRGARGHNGESTQRRHGRAGGRRRRMGRARRWRRRADRPWGWRPRRCHSSSSWGRRRSARTVRAPAHAAGRGPGGGGAGGRAARRCDGGAARRDGGGARAGVGRARAVARRRGGFRFEARRPDGRVERPPPDWRDELVASLALLDRAVAAEEVRVRELSERLEAARRAAAQARDALAAAESPAARSPAASSPAAGSDAAARSPAASSPDATSVGATSTGASPPITP